MHHSAVLLFEHVFKPLERHCISQRSPFGFVTECTFDLDLPTHLKILYSSRKCSKQSKVYQMYEANLSHANVSTVMPSKLPLSNRHENIIVVFMACKFIVTGQEEMRSNLFNSRGKQNIIFTSKFFQVKQY